MARKPTIRIEVHVSGILWDRIPEAEIPAHDDERGWHDFARTIRNCVANARGYRDEQLAIREARRTLK